jgi:hypothetical protein
MQTLENWMNEIVAKYADGHNEAIPGKLKDAFQSTMKANVVYHAEMATMLKTSDDKSLVNYHCLMSDMYRTFLCPEPNASDAG